jgi:aspartate 1-decarboxylase
MRTWVAGKIHGIRVSEKHPDYHGSVSIAPDLMAAAGIQAYEQVHVINQANGQRWITYAVPGAPGQFALNGGGARLGELGDPCILITYVTTEDFPGAQVVFASEGNAVGERLTYARP